MARRLAGAQGRPFEPPVSTPQGRPPQLFQDIVRSLHDLCPILEKAVRSAVAAAEDTAGDRHDVAALFEGVSRRNERSALFIGFDHHHGQRDPADESIPQRKVVRKRGRAGAELSETGPSVGGVTGGAVGGFGIQTHVYGVAPPSPRSS